MLTNYELIQGKGKPKRRGLVIEDVRDDLFDLTGGWPKRVGEHLFVEGPNCQPIYLDKPTKFFGWIDGSAHVDWSKGSDCVSQERFYANLTMSADSYDALETSPHFPPLPSNYYMHPPLPQTDTTYLDHLIDYFTPLTPTDRDLIRAFAQTLCWGGPPGSRPIFLITGPDHDPQPEKKGRGIGKSALVTLFSELVGGVMTFSQREDIVAIKKRLLSPAARSLRVALLDNVKTLRFSWADLEGLITANVVSGHEMYEGEGRRPNTLIWAVTLNGATLSKDIAERSVIIKLDRPEYNPHWESEVREYIKENRWEILNDIRLTLEN